MVEDLLFTIVTAPFKNIETIDLMQTLSNARFGDIVKSIRGKVEWQKIETQ